MGLILEPIRWWWLSPCSSVRRSSVSPTHPRNCNCEEAAGNSGNVVRIKMETSNGDVENATRMAGGGGGYALYEMLILWKEEAMSWKKLILNSFGQISRQIISPRGRSGTANQPTSQHYPVSPFLAPGLYLWLQSVVNVAWEAKPIDSNLYKLLMWAWVAARISSLASC